MLSAEIATVNCPQVFPSHALLVDGHSSVCLLCPDCCPLHKNCPFSTPKSDMSSFLCTPMVEDVALMKNSCLSDPATMAHAQRHPPWCSLCSAAVECLGRRCPRSCLGSLPGRKGYMGAISAWPYSQHHKAGACHCVPLECPIILPRDHLKMRHDEPRQRQSTSFLLWKNPGVRKEITPWSQIPLGLGVARVRLWCFHLSKSGNSSGSSSVLEPGGGDSVGASPADVLVRNDSPHQSPRDTALLLPPSPCQAKVPNSVPSCSDFQIAASQRAARALLHFSTWDPLVALLALCILK